MRDLKNSSLNVQRRGPAVLCAFLILLATFGPVAAQGQWAPGDVGVAAYLRPFNSVAFAVRPALPGRPAYLQAIRYIDNGMKYVDPFSGFFISSFGELCFRIFPNTPRAIYDNHHSDWCIYPQHVGVVEAMPNKITNINEVRLWCARPFPQCARRIGDSHSFDSAVWVANRIAAASIDYREQRAVLQDLIYLMGGNIAPALALSGGYVE